MCGVLLGGENVLGPGCSMWGGDSCVRRLSMPQGVLLLSAWGWEGFVIDIFRGGCGDGGGRKEFGVEWLADLCGGVMVGVASGRVGFWCLFAARGAHEVWVMQSDWLLERAMYIAGWMRA